MQWDRDLTGRFWSSTLFPDDRAKAPRDKAAWNWVIGPGRQTLCSVHMWPLPCTALDIER